RRCRSRAGPVTSPRSHAGPGRARASPSSSPSPARATRRARRRRRPGRLPGRGTGPAAGARAGGGCRIPWSRTACPRHLLEADGATPVILLRALAPPPLPLAPEDLAQVGASAARQQLDVVLADARDAHGIAGGPGDRSARDLPHERGPVSGLARETMRGRARGVPGVAEVEHGPVRPFLDEALGSRQLGAERGLALIARLRAAADGAALHHAPPPHPA